jgi:GAF domain-containing protein
VRTRRAELKSEAKMDDADYVRGMERLLCAVQELSLARSLPDVQRIVRTSARELIGCDGATFVLRDDGKCFYADEDAIAPLWKGSRFPMESCISGWAMLNRDAAVIPDISKDSRIPQEAYRPTFVKSLVMVPIRKLDPIGAIGNYWARERQPSEQEVSLLQALADSTSIAMSWNSACAIARPPWRRPMRRFSTYP